MSMYNELDDFQKIAVAEFYKIANAEGFDFGDAGRAVKSTTGEVGQAFSDLGSGMYGNAKALGNQVTSGFSDLGTGLKKDLEDISGNWAKNWKRNAKESQYGNFANIGPLIPLGIGVAGLGYMGAKGILGKILRRGK